MSQIARQGYCIQCIVSSIGNPVFCTQGQVTRISDLRGTLPYCCPFLRPASNRDGSVPDRIASRLGAGFFYVHVEFSIATLYGLGGSRPSAQRGALLDGRPGRRVRDEGAGMECAGFLPHCERVCDRFRTVRWRRVVGPNASARYAAGWFPFR